MVEGISKIIFALTIRPFPNWSWVLAAAWSASCSRVYLWANMPIDIGKGARLPARHQLIVEGAALAYLAWRIRES